MSYVDETLTTGEQIRYRAEIHWAIFVPHLFLMLFLVGMVTVFFAAARRASTEIAVTNRRVIIKTGLASRKTLEMNLGKVETLSVNQSVLGRLFGYGTIQVIGSGGTAEPLPYVANPLDLRKAIQEARDGQGA